MDSGQFVMSTKHTLTRDDNRATVSDADVHSHCFWLLGHGVISMVRPICGAYVFSMPFSLESKMEIVVSLT